ncbi:MAG TPA: hypothetical protein VKT82_10525 [Ktedonobacterales bacterium]|nr:hypothetical protein [Ktedonobacterales bacterium]
MRHPPRSFVHPAWWDSHQQALQLFRDLAALQRVRPCLERGTLAWRRLEREQAALEAAIDVLRRSV